MIRQTASRIHALDSILISWQSHAESQSNQSSSGRLVDFAVDSRR
jgi:hypothetical protein